MGEVIDLDEYRCSKALRGVHWVDMLCDGPLDSFG